MAVASSNGVVDGFDGVDGVDPGTDFAFVILYFSLRRAEVS
jgi:hypothetical protein